jgi:hypothetical protein
MSELQSVVERMSGLVSQWEAAGDRRSIFLSCYRLMTGNMLAAIQAGEFRDGQWISALLEHFAGYYFNALQAYEAWPSTAPAVWRVTFDVARDPKPHVLQNLMLGINAHINYDLIFAIADLLEPEWEKLSQEMREGRYADHCHVNRVIARTVDSVQDTIVERYSPGMDLVDRGFGPLDEWAISRLITAFREHVWRQALHRVEAGTVEQREHLRHEVETECLALADLVSSYDVVSALKKVAQLEER